MPANRHIYSPMHDRRRTHTHTCSSPTQRNKYESVCALSWTGEHTYGCVHADIYTHRTPHILTWYGCGTKACSHFALAFVRYLQVTLTSWKFHNLLSNFCLQNGYWGRVGSSLGLQSSYIVWQVRLRLNRRIKITSHALSKRNGACTVSAKEIFECVWWGGYVQPWHARKRCATGADTFELL